MTVSELKNHKVMEYEGNIILNPIQKQRKIIFKNQNNNDNKKYKQ